MWSTQTWHGVVAAVVAAVVVVVASVGSFDADLFKVGISRNLEGQPHFLRGPRILTRTRINLRTLRVRIIFGIPF